MCDWGGGPYGNGAYDPHGITKHMEETKVAVASAVAKTREVLFQECSGCGDEVKVSWSFCPHCGARI